MPDINHNAYEKYNASCRKWVEDKILRPYNMLLNENMPSEDKQFLDERYRYHLEQNNNFDRDTWVKARLFGNFTNNNYFRIVLDQRFWIYIRDTILETEGQPQFPEMLDLMQKAKLHCKALFLMSDINFVEFNKIDKMESRIAIGRAIDHFSNGFAIASFDTRLATEVGFYEMNGRGEHSLLGIQAYVLSRVGHILGFAQPPKLWMDKRAHLAYDKALVDLFWKFSAKKMVRLLGPPPKQPYFDDLAARINVDFLCSGSIGSSYREIFEFCYKEIMPLVVPLKEFEAKEEYIDTLIDPSKRHDLSSMHIGTHLIARFMIQYKESGRKIEKNDIFDVNHACAALPYCHAFFTERKLSNMLNFNKFDLSKSYACEVKHKMDDVMEYLKNILPELDKNPPITPCL